MDTTKAFTDSWVFATDECQAVEMLLVKELPGDKTLLCDPFTNPALRESYVRLNPDIRDETSLNILINGLDVDLEKLFEFFRGPDTIFHHACDFCCDGFGVMAHWSLFAANLKPPAYRD
jgi:hypothetical protein